MIALRDDEVRLVALGGLSEIGMNCLVLERRTEGGEGVARLVVDCGVVYPLGDHGVDCHHPRFDHLTAEPETLDGLVLTHGHEDHIGGVAYLLEQLVASGRTRPLVIVGPPYAVGLCERRLEEHGLARERYELRVVEPGSRFAIDAWSLESVAMTHSMIDATALAIDTPAGRVVHSGDFKLDDAPFDGRVSDVAALSRIGAEGVRLLLSDSTNVFAEGHTGSEAVSAEALDRIVGAAPARVVVGMFASNLHRLDALARAAQRHGRRLCLLGRSMYTHSELGMRLGRLDWPEDLLVRPALARSLPRSSVVWAATGTQGERRGALRRLASRQHPDLTLEEGDVVALSSRIIPGNERAVSALMDDFAAQGATVLSRLTDPDIHVSGHAYRDEQLRLLELLTPRAFVPLHGTRIHLLAHAQLANSAGVDEVQVMLNGEALRLSPEELAPDGEVVAGKVAVAGGVELAEEVLSVRRALGRSGVVFVTLHRGARAVHVASLRAIGLPEGAEREAGRVAARVLSQGHRSRSDETVAEDVRRALRSAMHELSGSKPTVEVQWTRGIHA